MNLAKIKASGVLPLAIHQGQIMLLLGQEDYFSSKQGGYTWCGFGGGREKGERVVDAAIREFMEESMALIMGEEEIGVILRGDRENKEGRLLANYYLTTYVEYVVMIPYDQQLPQLFARVRKQLLKCKNLAQTTCLRQKKTPISAKCTEYEQHCGPHFEKRQIAWFPLSTIKQLIEEGNRRPNLLLRRSFVKCIVAAWSLLMEAVQTIQDDK